MTGKGPVPRASEALSVGTAAGEEGAWCQCLWDQGWQARSAGGRCLGLPVRLCAKLTLDAPGLAGRAVWVQGT